MIIIPCVDLRNAELDRDYVRFALTVFDILHVCEAEIGGLFFNEVRIQRKHEPVLGSVGSVSRRSVLAKREGPNGAARFHTCQPQRDEPPQSHAALALRFFPRHTATERDVSAKTAGT